LALCIETYDQSKALISKEVPYLNTNQPNIYNLQNKDFFFLEALFMPKEIEAILKHFLNDKWFKQIPQEYPNYILRSFGARSSNTALPLHIDSFIPYAGENAIAMQYAIALEDQSEENGCTVVVPRSHQSAEYATSEALRDAITIEPRAGDVVMWDSRLWHGTTANTTSGTRWAMIATFTRWWVKQHFNITDNLPQSNYEKLTDSQKAILGFCSIPYNTEYEGIDLKRGYDKLLSRAIDYRNVPD
jgi:ectoine hydroxylase-related dioxygenase (phytanoyl-CoA dioxygenase family)